jgi:hypothetical protein
MSSSAGISQHTSKESTPIIGLKNDSLLLIRTPMDSLKVILSALQHERTTELATYLAFLSIVVIRISLGYFPTRTKWFGFFGLVGLLQLWLKHSN